MANQGVSVVTAAGVFAKAQQKYACTGPKLHVDITMAYVLLKTEKAKLELVGVLNRQKWLLRLFRKHRNEGDWHALDTALTYFLSFDFTPQSFELTDLEKQTLYTKDECDDAASMLCSAVDDIAAIAPLSNEKQSLRFKIAAAIGVFVSISQCFATDPESQVWYRNVLTSVQQDLTKALLSGSAKSEPSLEKLAKLLTACLDELAPSVPVTL